MNRYLPLTGHDSNVPSLLIDTQAPLDVLHDAAMYRIRMVTESLERFAESEQVTKDAIVRCDLAKLLGCQLRDGCDLLDVIGWRLKANA